MLNVLLAAAVLQIGDMARIVDLEEPAISPDAATSRGHRDRGGSSTKQRGQHPAARRRRGLRVRRGSSPAATSPFHAGPLKELNSPISPGLRRTAYASSSSRTSDGHTIQLTHAQGDVVDAAWSPDGRRLAFVATDPQDPAPFFYAGDNDYTATALTPPDHLWLVSAAGGKAARLTSGSWTIAPTDPGGIFSPQIAWTRDGRRITYTRVENTFSGDSEYSTLWQVDVATRATHKLTAHSASS